MGRVVDALVGLCALMLLVIGGWWVVDPAGAAVQLGMVLLEGAGRASQIGDGGAFFLGTGSMLAIGLWRRDASLLAAGGLIVGAVAVLRVLAATVHGAAFTPEPIVVEVVTMVAALIAARSAAAQT